MLLGLVLKVLEGNQYICRLIETFRPDVVVLLLLDQGPQEMQQQLLVIRVLD